MKILCSINSVNINISVVKDNNIENILLNFYGRYLMRRANQIELLEKLLKIDNYHLEKYKKEAIIDFIIGLIKDFSEVTDFLKIMDSLNARNINSNFMKQLKI